MSEIVLREARPEELDAVSALMSEAYAEYMPADADEVWREYRDEIADVWSRLDLSILIVAEEDGRLVGAVTYFPNGNEAEGWPSGYVSFRLLSVPPKERGRGIGRLLTDECLRRARAQGATVIGLHTTDFMSTAKSMYERRGFVRDPERDFFPGDVVVLAYRLSL